MNDNYRRTITFWLKQMETELVEMRAAIQCPRDSTLLKQRIHGSQQAALRAMDGVLKEIEEVATKLGLTRHEEDLLWSAHTQLLSTEISVGELMPERWPGGPTLIGDDGDVARVSELLGGLLQTVRVARETLLTDREDKRRVG